jgi:hypothetical protein
MNVNHMPEAESRKVRRSVRALRNPEPAPSVTIRSHNGRTTLTLRQ